MAAPPVSNSSAVSLIALSAVELVPFDTPYAMMDIIFTCARCVVAAAALVQVDWALLPLSPPLLPPARGVT